MAMSVCAHGTAYHGYTTFLRYYAGVVSFLEQDHHPAQFAHSKTR